MQGLRRTDSPRRQLSVYLDAEDYDALKQGSEQYGVAIALLARAVVKRGLRLELEARRKKARQSEREGGGK